MAGKRRQNRAIKSRRQKINSFVEPRKKPSFFSKLNKPYKIVAAIIAFFVTGYGIIEATNYFIDLYHRKSTPSSEIFAEQTFQHGIRISQNVIDKSTLIFVNYGTGIMGIPIANLRSGVAIAGPILNPPFDLRVRLSGDRILITATFRYIENNQLIGKMIDNQWEAKNNIYKYHDTDDNLEILDPSGYVMFNMRYEFPNAIIISGYSVNEDIIWVVNGNSLQTFDLKDKENAIKAIAKIKPLNYYPVVQ